MTKLVINPSKKQSKINKEIYGHFSEHLGRCIYEGIYVGEDSPIPNKNGMRTDVVEALKHIRIPVLRWPGGCFADEYHWKDGIGPKETRKKMINTHWGGVVEDKTTAVVGEQGAEAIVPLENNTGWIKRVAEQLESNKPKKQESIKLELHLNIEKFVNSREEDIEELAERLMNVIQEKIDRKGVVFA